MRLRHTVSMLVFAHNPEGVSMADKQNNSRRKVLQRVAAIGAAASLPVGVLKPAAAADAVPARGALQALTATEAGILEAVVARLIPSDESGPGAKEARAADYIDRSLAGALAGSRKAYAVGLAAVDAYAQSSKGAAFASLPPADQDELLTAMQKNAATGFTPNSAAFFNLLLSHTIQGTFCDPAYGGNANFVGWDMIGYPGIRLAVAPEEQRMGVKVKPHRQSAYVDATLSKGGAHGH
jgi:gluconate 2-dehydrogenase gamma chain